MIGCYMDKNPRQDMPGGDFLRVPGGYMLYCSVIPEEKDVANCKKI